MKLTLINYAQAAIDSDIPIPLWGLTESGKSRAKALSSHPLVKDVNILYSSLQTSSIETTLYLAKPNYIPINTSMSLIEVSSFTTLFLEDRYKDYVEEFYKKVIQRIGEGETYEEALHRFDKVIDEIIEQESDKKNIGIVSHTNILSMFSSRFCDKTPLEIHNIMQNPDVAVLDWSTKKFLTFWGSGINS